MSVRKIAWNSRLCSVLIASTICSGAALASPASADETYDRCISSSSTNSAWFQCGGQYLTRLDDDLNDAWKAVFLELTPEGKMLLRTEQRAWVEFKEASCAYYGNGDFGREGQVLHFPMCRAEIIEQRIDYLNQLGQFTTGEN